MLTSPKLLKTKPRKVYKYHKADCEGLRSDLTKLSSDIITGISTPIDSDWTKFKNGIFLAMDKHIPFSFSSKKSVTPWITPSIRRKLRNKQRSFNRARSSGRDDDKHTFRLLRKKIQKDTKIAYWKWVRNSCIDSPKQFWSFVKKLRKDNMGIPALRKQAKLFSDSKTKAELLNDQFESVFTNEDPMVNLPNQRVYPPMPDFVIHQNGVLKLLSNLDANKAPGPDGVPGKILKQFAGELSPALTHIFNKSLVTGQLPSDWLTANITPIYKKGDRAVASNYRPVSLTPICCKLLEHIIHSNVMGHFNKYHILTNRQYGFRKQHSCESQLLITVDDLARALDSHTPVDMVIMDFSKAFDTVPHQRLLFKLHNLGVTGKTHTWVTNFLCKRRQRVVVDGEHSQWVQVRSGVPQGTVLGPLLFLAYINDLPDHITSEVRLFADDCVMYRTVHDDSDIQCLQADLDKLFTWQNLWQMQFNVQKCFTMKFSHARKKSSHQYKLGQFPLQEVNSHTYLGIHLTNDLKWDTHINHAISKAKRVLGVVCRNLHPCTTKLKSTAYIALVRPHLEYCSSVWDPTSVELRRKLESVQRKAARFATRNYDRTSSVSVMLKSLQWDTLQLRRQSDRLTTLHKITLGQVAIPADQFLTPVVRPTRHNNSQAFFRPRAKKNCYRDSYFPKTISEWNILPDNLVHLTSPEAFKKQVTQHLRQYQ